MLFDVVNPIFFIFSLATVKSLHAKLVNFSSIPSDDKHRFQADVRIIYLSLSIINESRMALNPNYAFGVVGYRPSQSL